MSDRARSVNALAAGETANFFSVSRESPLECLSARFRRHVYAPHTHDSFVVGTIVAGCEAFRIGGRRDHAVPGDLCLIAPGVVHDGEPAGDGYAYRISYPAPELLQDVLADASELRRTGTPDFTGPVVRDPELAALFATAHQAAETRGNSLEADELLHRFFVRLLARHGRASTRPRDVAGPAAGERGPVARACDYIDAHFAEAVDLASLARIADLPRTRLIRAMRRETGFTPHAWLMDRRIRAACRMLRHGEAPAEVAIGCGFYDQSHLNRVFKARIGVPPGAFHAAHHHGRHRCATH